MIMGVMIESERKNEFIQMILQLGESQQELLVSVVQRCKLMEVRG
jgi:hypothetical protein